ncbi:MAG: phage holin family protein [Rhodospirillales bacterium]|nr:phage holin family protein [Rhodospirillales bacterium]
MNSDNRPVAQLLGDLIESVNKLLQQQLQLVRVEATEKAREALMGVIGIIGGMLVALAALLVLVQAVVVALANHMPPEIAALIVGVVLAVIAFFLVRAGRTALDAKNLALPKTAESLKRDKELVAETVG